MKEEDIVQKAVKDFSEALQFCFVSPNVSDSNFEAANIVDVLNYIANSNSSISKSLAGTQENELHYIGKGLHRIADALEEIALQHQGVGNAITEVADKIP